MIKVGRERCDRCHRVIKNGRVMRLHDRPYGENCYKIALYLEINLAESLDFTSEAPITVGEHADETL